MPPRRAIPAAFGGTTGGSLGVAGRRIRRTGPRRRIPMTVFGKILVFMNLLFSVVTGALIVFVFTTRANWVAAYGDAKAKAEANEKVYLAEKVAHDNDRKQAEASDAALRAEVTALRSDLVKAQGEAEQLRRTADTQINLHNTSANTAQRLQA